MGYEGEWGVEITSKFIPREMYKKKTTSNAHFKVISQFPSVALHWNEPHRCPYHSKQICNTRVEESCQ